MFVFLLSTALVLIFPPTPTPAPPPPDPNAPIVDCLYKADNYVHQQYPCRWHAPDRADGSGESFIRHADHSITIYTPTDS